MIRRPLAAAVLLLCAAGCSWTNEVRHRAAFDLNCEEEKVDVQTISGITAEYGARGCGRQAAYVVREGQVLMNSPVMSYGEAPATVAPDAGN